MNKKIKGFTLVELIIVMAIISILMVAMMNMFKPIREIYVDSTQYEAQRTVQNGVVQYITESVRFSTDMGIYDTVKGVSSASSAVDNFATAFCINNNITDASGIAIAPYTDTGELANIKNEIKKYAEVIIIDNSTNHKYNGKNYTGRIIRRKFPTTPSATVPADPALTSSATADWRIALGEAYYGSNTFAINITVKDGDSTASPPIPADGTSDDGMLNVSVASTANAKRDISKMGKENDVNPNASSVSVSHLAATSSGVLCRNLVSGSNGVTNQGIFDVSKYSGSSATSGSKTYIVFLNKDGKDKVDAVVKTAAATP